MADIRLDKITRKYNIGLATVIDFLKSKGVFVEPTPKAKVSDELLPLFESAFAVDQKDLSEYERQGQCHTENISNNNDREPADSSVKLSLEQDIQNIEETEVTLKVVSISFPFRIVTEPFGDFKAGVLLPQHITSGGLPISMEWLSYLSKGLFSEGNEYSFTVLDHLSNWEYAILGYDIGELKQPLLEAFESLTCGAMFKVAICGETPNYYIVDMVDLPFKGVVLKNSIDTETDLDEDKTISLQLAEKGGTPLEMLTFVKPLVLAKDEELREVDDLVRDFLLPEELDVISEEDMAIVSYLLANYPSVKRENCNQVRCDIFCRVPENSPMLAYLNTHPGYLADRSFWINSYIDKDSGKEKIVLFHPKPTVTIELTRLDESQFVVSSFDSQSRGTTRTIIKNNNRRAKLKISSQYLHFISRYEGIPSDYSTASVLDLISKLYDVNDRIFYGLKKATEKRTNASAEDYIILENYLDYQIAQEKEGISDSVFIEAARLSPCAGSAIGDVSLKLELNQQDIDDLLGEDEDGIDGLHVSIVDESGDCEHRVGVLHSDGLNATLVFLNSHVDLDDYLVGGIYLRRRANTKHLEIQRWALNEFVRKDSLGIYQDLINDRLTPINVSQYDSLQFVNPIFDRAGDDNNQTLAVKKALANENVLLIQGPPGTGKTTIIVEIINQLVKEGKKVLVCSQAHAAVANIYDRLDKQKLDILRLEDAKEISVSTKNFDAEVFSSFLKRNRVIISKLMSGASKEDVQDYISGITYEKGGKELERRYLDMHKHLFTYFIDQAELDRDRIMTILDNLEAEITSINGYMLEAEMYRSKDVVMGTCIGIGMNKVLKQGGVRFDTVIIDEAGKANLAETIVPMQLGKRFVLVGDHKQLPPFIDRQEIAEYVDYVNDSDKEGEDDARLNEKDVVLSLSNSLFADFYNHEHFPEENKITLNYQFRMHPEICNYISKLFYGGALKSGEGTEKQNVYVDGYKNPVVFVDTTTSSYDPENDPKESSAGDGSIYNDMEVSIICNKILPAVQEAMATDPTLKLGIITPYKSQYYRLRSHLRDSEFRDCVHTIDSIQGSEFDIVIFSFVRSFTKRSGKTVGFLDDMRRLNVSLSRAKKKLILVGNLNTLQRPEAHNDYGIPDMVSPVKVFESIATNTKKFSNATDYERFLETKPQIGQIYEDVDFEIRDGKIVFALKLRNGTMRFSMPDNGLSKREHLDVVFRGLRERDGRPLFYPADLEHFSEKHNVGDLMQCTIRSINGAVKAEADGCVGIIDRHTLPQPFEEPLSVGQAIELKVEKLDLSSRVLLLARKTPFETFVLSHNVGDVVEGVVSKIMNSSFVTIRIGDVTGTLRLSNTNSSCTIEYHEGDRITVVISELNGKTKRLRFSKTMSECLNSLRLGFVQFSATIREKKNFPITSVEMEYGEVMDISCDMLWNVGMIGRSYDLVCFPKHRFAFNDRVFKDFTGCHLVNDRIDGVVVSESDFGYFVEIKEGVYGFIAKSYLQKKKLICGKSYIFRINRFDNSKKNILLGL